FLPGTGVRVALALWVVAHGSIDPTTSWPEVATALGMSAVTWIFVAPNRLAPDRVAAVDAGAIVGAALCATLLLWPYAEGAAFQEVARWQNVLFATSIFAGVLLSGLGWERVRHRVPAFLSGAIVSWVALGLAVDGAALAFHHLRPQSI